MCAHNNLMKPLIPFYVVIMFVSCNQSVSLNPMPKTTINNLSESEKLPAHYNEGNGLPLVCALNAAAGQTDSQAATNCPPMGNGRNLVYLLNPKEVSSVAGYAVLIFNLGFGQCRYDSLITVVRDVDMCNIESQLEKAHVARPSYERKFYDSTGRTTRSLEAAAQGCNLLLFENRKLIFSCRVQDYLANEQTSYYK